VTTPPAIMIEVVSPRRRMHGSDPHRVEKDERGMPPSGPVLWIVDPALRSYRDASAGRRMDDREGRRLPTNGVIFAPCRCDGLTLDIARRHVGRGSAWRGRRGREEVTAHGRTGATPPAPAPASESGGFPGPLAAPRRPTTPSGDSIAKPAQTPRAVQQEDRLGRPPSHGRRPATRPSSGVST